MSLSTEEHAEHIQPDVFQRAGLTVAAIVEQRIEFAVRRLEHMLGRGGD
jgi:hypothetical protein